MQRTVLIGEGDLQGVTNIKVTTSQILMQEAPGQTKSVGAGRHPVMRRRPRRTHCYPILQGPPLVQRITHHTRIPFRAAIQVAVEDEDVASNEARTDQAVQTVTRVPGKVFVTSGIYNKSGTARKVLPLPRGVLYNEMKRPRAFKLPYFVYQEFFDPQSSEVSQVALHTPKQGSELPAWKIMRKNAYVKMSPPSKTRDLPRCVCRPGYCDEDCLNRVSFIECDPSCCRSGLENCSNRAIQELTARLAVDPQSIGIKIVHSGNKGYGLYATRDFAPHELILEYTGDIIDTVEMERRLQNDYRGSDKFYCLSLGQGLAIDSGRRGSEARFVNHSCNPNSEMQKWYVRGAPRIGLFAGEKGVSAGTEFTYDYNFDVFTGTTAQKCFCGEPTCRGTIGKRPPKSSGSAVANEALPKAVSPLGPPPVRVRIVLNKTAASQEDHTALASVDVPAAVTPTVVTLNRGTSTAVAAPGSMHSKSTPIPLDPKIRLRGRWGQILKLKAAGLPVPEFPKKKMQASAVSKTPRRRSARILPRSYTAAGDNDSSNGEQADEPANGRSRYSGRTKASLAAESESGSASMSEKSSSESDSEYTHQTPTGLRRSSRRSAILSPPVPTPPRQTRLRTRAVVAQTTTEIAEPEHQVAKPVARVAAPETPKGTEQTQDADATGPSVEVPLLVPSPMGMVWQMFRVTPINKPVSGGDGMLQGLALPSSAINSPAVMCINANSTNRAQPETPTPALEKSSKLNEKIPTPASSVASDSDRRTASPSPQHPLHLKFQLNQSATASLSENTDLTQVSDEPDVLSKTGFTEETVRLPQPVQPVLQIQKLTKTTGQLTSRSSMPLMRSSSSPPAEAQGIINPERRHSVEFKRRTFSWQSQPPVPTQPPAMSQDSPQPFQRPPMSFFMPQGPYHTFPGQMMPGPMVPGPNGSGLMGQPVMAPSPQPGFYPPMVVQNGSGVQQPHVGGTDRS